MKVSRQSIESRQLRIEDYLNGQRLEAKANLGVLSNVSATQNGQNDEQGHSNTLLEGILDLGNMVKAYKRVKRNKGAAGIDGMVVEELQSYMQENGKALKQKILSGEYAPQPVRRVEIPKPNGGIRLLGIPTVIDRLIQQAISQKLNELFDQTFSNSSYGFRPGRSAQQAVEQARQYIDSGYKYVIDIDLANYFDTVNHDLLMHLVSKKIKDKRVLKLIRSYLNAGVMKGGMVGPTEEGVPQGGPLSPLLSNIMLDELDKELEERGHLFCRYADDCNIFVKTKKAGKRVMESVVKFLECKLKLKVNQEKSDVVSAEQDRFLGFSFYFREGRARIIVHPKSFARLKAKIKDITGRSNSKSIKTRIYELNKAIKGWVNYFQIADMKTKLEKLDKGIRRRLRMCYWKQWKKTNTKRRNLVKLGISNSQAWQFANTRKSYWRTSNSPILSCSLTNNFFKEMGLYTLTTVYGKIR